MPDDAEPSIAALESRPPGFSPDDPYDGVEISELPEWWREAIHEYEAHDLRPYQPPRFDDGTLTHDVVSKLEAEHGVSIVFLGFNVKYRDDWTIRIDGEDVGTIGRHRSANGYSVFEMERDEFVEFVRTELEDTE